MSALVGRRLLCIAACATLGACAKGGIPATSMGDGGAPLAAAAVLGHPTTAPSSTGTGAAATSAAPGTAVQPQGPATGVAPPPPPPADVHLTLRTSPMVKKPKKCKVYWGKKLLGVVGPKPLQFDRPRDSGPLDLVVRADEFFPVHVRVFTFKNDAITVQLTKLTDRMKLFGAREEVPPAESTAAMPPGAQAVPPVMGAPTPGGTPTPTPGTAAPVPPAGTPPPAQGPPAPR